MRTIFALASGRSGTHFLYEVIHRNATNCIARHETYIHNPSMFGRPIYDHARGDREPIRRLLEKKRRIIQRYSPATYVETSHAFLKSYFDLAVEFFPEIKPVHLVRHPLKVAKSLANREALIHRLRIPFCHYRGGDGRWYFRWSLTGLEPIYQHFDLSQLTLFQRCLLEWIEIENRAARFLDEHQEQADCMTLRVPEDINDPERLELLFRQLDLLMRHPSLDLAGRRNQTPGVPTVITEDDEREFEYVVNRLPGNYLSIFRSERYASCSWAPRLWRKE